MNPAPLFPERPHRWFARGVYRNGGLRGQPCSACVYTRTRGQVSARAAAEESFPWMRVASVHLAPGSES